MTIIELCITTLFSMGMLYSALSDLETRRVPNSVQLYLAAVSLAWAAATGMWLNLIGILPAALFYVFCYRHTRGIGGADIKLTAVLGVFQGLVEGMALLLAACIIALLAEAGMRLFKSRHRTGIPLCFYIGLVSVAWCMAGIGIGGTI